MLKLKPQPYDCLSDIGEYLTQFNIIAEINGWSYSVKSLYLASSLTGNARSLLSELNETQKRDYDSIANVLHTRYGTKNRAEIYRATLKSMRKQTGQSLSELAQEIKKLTRQAYPDANSDIQETLALDYFIDSLTDLELRLRLRECCPKTMQEAETVAVRLEAHRLADKKLQVSENVCAMAKPHQNNDTRTQFQNLESRVEKLTEQVEKLVTPGNQIDRNMQKRNTFQQPRNGQSNFRPQNDRFQNRNRFTNVWQNGMQNTNRNYNRQNNRYNTFQGN